MSKLNKIFIPVAILSSVFLAAGCSNVKEERSQLLNTNLVTKLIANENVKDFKLMGTDVDRTGFMFNVNFNGVAKTKSGKQAFASVEYKVPSTYFENLDKRSHADSVYDVFDKIVNDFDYTNCAISEVSNLKTVNNSFINNAPSPFADYNIKKGLVYNLSVPTFDDSENKISFEVKTLMELENKAIKYSFGVGFHLYSPFTGFQPCFILGYHTSVTKKEGSFVTTDNYSIQVNDELYNEMKNDTSLVYDYCVDAIENKQDEKMDAMRYSTNYVTYDNADLLNHFDMEKVSNEYSN